MRVVSSAQQHQHPRPQVLLVDVPDRTRRRVDELDHVFRAGQLAGRLALAFFNPRLDTIAPRLTSRGATTFLEDTYDLLNGERLLQWACTRYDATTQVSRTERMYDRVGADGRLIERTYRQITVRWLYRYEAEHLFIRAGFEIEALYGDFAGGSFDEQSEEKSDQQFLEKISHYAALRSK